MFLFVLLQQIHIIGKEATEGTHQGLSCVGLLYLGIATILQSPHSAALRAGPSLFPHLPLPQLVFPTPPASLVTVQLYWAPFQLPVVTAHPLKLVLVLVLVLSCLSGDGVAMAGPQPLQSP